MAQAELAEMLFSGKSEKSAVEQQIRDMQSIFEEGDAPKEAVTVSSSLERLQLTTWEAIVPGTPVHVEPLSLDIARGEWIALYGETGKGKTTFLNSLFYPEYRRAGILTWNETSNLLHLPVPKAIYVTQKAYLLTGTLRENFEGYSDEEIEGVLKTVDLASWRAALQEGLGSFLGKTVKR